VYLYEYSARRSYRVSLPQIRKGGYEQLPHKMASEKWQPDYGPAFNPKNKDSILQTGATVIGARDILVALNISLSTSNKKIAVDIAARLRSSGSSAASKMPARPRKHLGLFPALRAIGWFIEDFHAAQVSFNFLDYRVTSPLEVWEATKVLAREFGCEAIGCEVIGLIPKQCVLEAGILCAEKKGLDIAKSEERQLIAWGIEYLRLDQLKPFDPEEKILEYALARAGLM
jgi:glutamate formiminotransferase/formiminotetrahydrofolate cyclodeaminase